MTSQIGNLSNRAMLCTLSISQWSARKLDKAATNKTTSDAGASTDAARVNKFLLAGQDGSLKEIAKIATQARSVVYELTQPWDKAGATILSVDLWPRLNRELSDLARGIGPDPVRDTQICAGNLKSHVRSSS